MQRAKTITAIYEAVGGVIIDTIIYQLKSYAKYPIDYQDSSLIKSLDYDIGFKERDLETGRFKGIKLTLFANDYLQWLDKGRKPGTKKVPIDALIKFIKKRKLQQKFRKATKRGRGRYMSLNQIAFMIQASIYKKGIKPRNVLIPALEEGQKVLQAYLDRELLDILIDPIFEFYATQTK
jgi:hypothetical protein